MATQQVHPMQVLHRGAKSDAARALQAATNRRLQRRGLAEVAIDEDGVVGAKTMAAVTAAAWALGAHRETIARMDGGEIPIGVQRMIRNPGRRTDEQKALGQEARRAHARRAQAARGRRGPGGLGPQARRPGRPAGGRELPRRPGAYHYLAGGRANAVCLKPTPSDWRSDCSQFVAAVYKEAGLPSPATVAHEFAATSNIDPKGRVTTSPRPGDLGMYGDARRLHPSRRAVLRRCPAQEFIGHGSRADRLGHARAGPTTT